MSSALLPPQEKSVTAKPRKLSNIEPDTFKVKISKAKQPTSKLMKLPSLEQIKLQKKMGAKVDPRDLLNAHEAEKPAINAENGEFSHFENLGEKLKGRLSVEPEMYKLLEELQGPRTTKNKGTKGSMKKLSTMSVSQQINQSNAGNLVIHGF